MDISSPFEGVVTEVSFKAGDTIKTGSTLLLIDVVADASDAAASAPAPAAPAAKPASLPAAAPAPASASRGSAVKAFQLTDIGEGIAEVELLQVFVKPGDKIQPYDKLVEVQSDKVRVVVRLLGVHGVGCPRHASCACRFPQATVDISSPFEGIVRDIKFKPGDVVKTGSTLLTVEVEGEVEDSAPVAASQPGAGASEAGSAPAATAPSGAVNTGKYKALATPAVRRIAKENNIDITQVRVGVVAAVLAAAADERC